jgi:hypothetical protein
MNFKELILVSKIQDPVDAMLNSETIYDVISVGRRYTVGNDLKNRSIQFIEGTQKEFERDGHKYIEALALFNSKHMSWVELFVEAVDKVNWFTRPIMPELKHTSAGVDYEFFLEDDRVEWFAVLTDRSDKEVRKYETFRYNREYEIKFNREALRVLLRNIDSEIVPEEYQDKVEYSNQLIDAALKEQLEFRMRRSKAKSGLNSILTMMSN